MITKTNYNQLKENLPTKKYMIYGLSSFELAQYDKYTSFNIDVSVDTPNAYTLNVNNADNVTNVIFQADMYTPPLSTFCKPTIEFSSLSTELDNAIDGDYTNLVYLKSRRF